MYFRGGEIESLAQKREIRGSGRQSQVATARWPKKDASTKINGSKVVQKRNMVAKKISVPQHCTPTPDESRILTHHQVNTGLAISLASTRVFINTLQSFASEAIGTPVINNRRPFLSRFALQTTASSRATQVPAPDKVMLPFSWTSDLLRSLATLRIQRNVSNGH